MIILKVDIISLPCARIAVLISVIASEAKQSLTTGLLRRFVPRNDTLKIESRNSVSVRDNVIIWTCLVCADGRCCRFGKIENGEMILNGPGKMAYELWEAMPFHYPGVQIDAFTVMPNHLHGIIIIGVSGVGTGPCACPETARNKLSLSDLISRYKSLTTRKYIDGVARDDWPLFNQKLWQRSFYDHVIRYEHTLQRIRESLLS